MAEARGIEIFGRGATVVDTSLQVGPRRPWLGAVSVLLGILTAVATALGVLAASAGAADGARWLAIAGIACSILGFVMGFVAVAASRGVGAGFVGMALSVAANPWVLTRLLEWAETLSGVS